MPHADGTAEFEVQKNGSRTIRFSDGDYSMEDNFFGGDPYGGQQVVFFKNEPCWMMVYYGGIYEEITNPDGLYDFLREALQNPPKKLPFRGPESYKNNNFEYKNQIAGSDAEFSGNEKIFKDGKQVYWAKYIGGLVDQRFNGSL